MNNIPIISLRKQVTFHEMDVCLLLDQKALFPWQLVFTYNPQWCVPSEDAAANTNFIVFGLTQPELEPTI